MAKQEVSLLRIFDKCISSGIPSNAAWDLIKYAYEKLTERSWEELYLEAFKEALRAESRFLRKYTSSADDEISLPSDELKRILHYRLAVPIPLMSYSELTEEKFVQSAARALAENETLIIGGHTLSEYDYQQLILNIVRKATAIFEQTIAENPAAFQLAIVREAKNHRQLLLEVHDFCETQFDLTLTLIRDVLFQLEMLSKGQESIAASQEMLQAGQLEVKDEVQHFRERFNAFARLDTLVAEVITEGIRDTSKHFYRGFVGWNDIIQDYDIRRKPVLGRGSSSRQEYARCLTDLEGAYEYADKNGMRVIKIFGEAGSGKTTFLMRLAYDLYVSGYPVLYRKEAARHLDESEIRRFQREKGRAIFVFIDDVALTTSIKSLYDLSSALGYMFPMVLVISGHPGHWEDNKRKKRISGLPDPSGRDLEYELSKLDVEEIDDLLCKLKNTDNLGKLAGYTHAERVSVFFRKLAENQLLVALREAIEAPEGKKHFDHIILVERAQLEEEAQHAYDTVALLHSYGVYVPRTVLQKVVQLKACTDYPTKRIFDERVLDPTTRIIVPTMSIEYRPPTELLRTRHRIIAEVVKHAVFHSIDYTVEELEILIELVAGESQVEKDFLFDVVKNARIKYEIEPEDMDRLLEKAFHELDDSRDRSVILDMRARNALDHGKQDKAESLFRQAIELCEKNLYPYHGYGWHLCWEVQKNREKALEQLNAGLAHDEANAYLCHAAGTIEHRSGFIENAEEYLLRGLDEHPDDLYLLSEYIKLLRESDRLDEALLWSSSAVEQHRQNPIVLATHASLLYRLGRSKWAIDYFERALSMDPDNFLTLSAYGSALTKLGRIDEALAKYEKALELDPENPVTLVSYYTALRQANREADAVEALEKAAELTPDNATTLATLGSVLMELDETDRALSYLERARALEPNNVRTLRKLAELLVTIGHGEEALEVLDEALETSPETSGLLLEYARVLRENGQLEEAVAFLRRAHELKPDNAFILSVLAATLGKLGRYKEALPRFEKALDLQPRNPITLAVYGSTLRKLGRIDEALAKYEKALELDPDNPVTLVSYATALRQAGESRESVDNYKRALEIIPSNASTLSKLGTTLLSMGELDEALVYLRKGYALDERNLHIIRTLSYVLREFGEDEEAVKVLKTGVELAPEHLGMILDYGRALRGCGRLEEAIAQARKAYEMKPFSLRVIVFLASTLRSLDLSEEALSYIEPEVSKNPRNHTVLTLYAAILRDLARLQDALLYFEKALELDPHNPITLRSYASVLHTLGQSKKALEYYERSLEIDPDNVITLNACASVLCRLGEFKEALTYYEKSVKVDPDNSDTLYKCGVLLFQQDLRNISQAADYLEKAAKLVPDSEHIQRWFRTVQKYKAIYSEMSSEDPFDELTPFEHRRLGRRLENNRDFEAALLHYRACLKKGVPENELPHLHVRLAQVSAKNNDPESALHHYQQALTLGLSNSTVHAGLARNLYLLQGEPDRIRAHLEKALELDQSYAVAHDWFSTFLKEIGEVDEAERHSRAAVSLSRERRRQPNAVFLNNLALVLVERGDKESLEEAEQLLEEAVECSSPGFDYPKLNLQKVQRLLQR